MNVDMYNFPVFNIETYKAVEQTYCDLLNAYRNGETIEPEALDWMDTANNWLMTTETNV